MAGVQLDDFSNIFSLRGKVAVVTGGSSGHGLSAASGILQAGASKVYISSRTASACDEACAALNALPNKHPDAQAIAVPADCSTLEGIKQLVEGVSQTTSHVDILLYNSGTNHAEAFDTHDPNKFSQVLDLNLKGAFYSIQKFTPLLTARATLSSPSRVIITGSVSGSGLTILGPKGTFSYAAAKAGVIHLARQLAVELGPRNILTNCISPGIFPTEMSRPIVEAFGGEEMLARTYPNGRLGRAEDFAGTVVYLASSAGAHVNGRDIVVDGGGSIGRVKGWKGGRAKKEETFGAGKLVGVAPNTLSRVL